MNKMTPNEYKKKLETEQAANLKGSIWASNSLCNIISFLLAFGCIAACLLGTGITLAKPLVLLLVFLGSILGGHILKKLMIEKGFDTLAENRREQTYSRISQKVADYAKTYSEESINSWKAYKDDEQLRNIAQTITLEMFKDIQVQRYRQPGKVNVSREIILDENEIRYHLAWNYSVIKNEPNLKKYYLNSLKSVPKSEDLLFFEDVSDPQKRTAIMKAITEHMKTCFAGSIFNPDENHARFEIGDFHDYTSGISVVASYFCDDARFSPFHHAQVE